MQGYIRWVGTAILFALIVIQVTTCNHYKLQSEEQSSLITASQDSIKYYKEKDGRNSAQIALLEGSKDNLLQIIGKSNYKLTSLLKKGATSATTFSQSTKLDTTVIVKRDTISGSIEYSNSIVNKWIKLDVKLKNDSLHTSFETLDSLSVSFQKVRQGFLKPRKSVVIVTNANPYVKSTGLQSFDVKSKPSSLKFWTGAGIGAVITYLLVK